LVLHQARRDYDDLAADVEAFNADPANKDTKRGIAVVPAKGNMGFVDCPDVNAGFTKVDVLRDGSVTVTHSGVEMGQGLSTRARAIAAHCLGVPLEDVHVRETSTFVLPNTPPTTMVSTDVVAETTSKCCEQILKRITTPETEGLSLREKMKHLGQTGERFM
jgi:xanthine dehydrogenase molybdopterin-binding subunit B